MSITVNTNVQALKIQTNLSKATTSMNAAMERMSSGYKINSAADDAAGSAISTTLETTLSSSKIASQNAQIGSNLLTTTEGTLDTIKSNLQRIRDLSEQAANGTYDSTSRDAIATEVTARAAEIDRLSKNTQFNGSQIFNAAGTAVDLQVGTGTDTDSTISLDASIFKAATVSVLGLGASAGAAPDFTVATGVFKDGSTSKAFLTNVDAALKEVTNRQTKIGAFQNRLTSAMSNLTTQQTNIAATNSTIKDADTATEASDYVKYQILQSASASLLTSANSAPQIALSLIKG